MPHHSNSPLNPTDAKTTGALYLAIAVCGGFSIGYVPTQIGASDGATSVANLMSNAGLFRLGVLADSAVILMEIAISVLLYQMFQATSPRLAMIALMSRFGMVVVMGINLLIWVMPMMIATSAENHGTEAIAQTLFRAHDVGIYIWQLFFGVHLLALGGMILRTDHVPRILGWGLFAGAFGYLLQGLVELTFTDVTVLDWSIVALLITVTFSELGFGVWLLISGRRNVLRYSQ